MQDQKVIKNKQQLYNEDKTIIFKRQKKKYKQDSVAWVVNGFLLLLFISISFARITIIGQLIDDLLFSYIFGWVKYLVYLILLVFDLCIFIQIKFKFKIRFKLMLLVGFIIILCLTSLILFTVMYQTNSSVYKINALWQKNIFNEIIKTYNQQSINHSVFNKQNYKVLTDYLINPQNYFNPYLGGGIIGSFIIAVLLYTSLPTTYIIVIFIIFIYFNWILTGDGFYLFKPKHKKRGKALRILYLSSKDTPIYAELLNQIQINDQDLKVNNNLNKIDNLNTNLLFDNKDINNSDLIIQLPSYVKAKKEELKDFKAILEDDYDLKYDLEIDQTYSLDDLNIDDQIIDDENQDFDKELNLINIKMNQKDVPIEQAREQFWQQRDINPFGWNKNQQTEEEKNITLDKLLSDDDTLTFNK
ncbi:hypothetical protein [Mycoplasma yeatsii]|uniref:ABC-type multidrug transport system fused ATPase/permease subunit n=1 Tax=Mycoplasma yeatsii TaxID=51365 RepID=A0ABU0NFV1_9MOLU|nr:hypothetical protein [Mycoplasma yeatsii]MDQ0567886.1 ABC-type multidrug transport system fused ATPase/permease subunit [Mycoplasma yeatsii]